MKKIILSVLALCLCFTVFGGSAFAENTAADKTISGLGTGAISNPSRGSWDNVYYGSKSDPIKFHVLQINETHFGGETMLLDCAGILKTMQYNTVSTKLARFWSNSQVKSWLNGSDFKNSRFTAAEISAMAESTKSAKADGYDGSGSSSLEYNELTGEKIFILDAVEVTNTHYGFDSSAGTSDTRKKSSTWWLRSSRATKRGFGCAGYANGGNGKVDYDITTSEYGVSPALNVNMADIVFASAVSDDTYKLTVKDENMTINAAGADRDGNKVTVSCTTGGDNQGSINRISVVMTDGTWSDSSGWSTTAEPKYYGALDSSNSFTLPENYDTGWNSYIIAESVNEGNATDYASTPAAFTVPDFAESGIQEFISYSADSGESGWSNKNGSWYYGDESGNAVTGTQSIDGVMYHFSDSGEMVSGWKELDGKWFHATDSGKLSYDGWEKIGGVWYYFLPDGEMATGWIDDGGLCYYLRDSGAMATGWIQDNGYWYYLNQNGAMMTGWLKDGNTWYWLGADGRMAAGNGSDDGNGFPASGEMATGWINDGGRWFYLRDNGAMATGWLWDNEDWYYLNRDGAMVTGWLKDGKNWYYLQSDGSMATGWINDGGLWYYLRDNGAMATGWIFTDGCWYYLNPNGAMVTGWLKEGNTWYWLDSDGHMVTGEALIDGQVNVFADSGAWLYAQ